VLLLHAAKKVKFPNLKSKKLYIADSTATVASEAIDQAGKTADQALDSASIRIKDIEGAKNDIQDKIESTSKMVDSLSDKIASTKLESKIEKKDSATKKPERTATMFQLLK
jgi:ABC-type transporter Mla subunit MlaD